MRTIPLVKANLKGFMRNWKSILLLIGFPLLLVGTVFLSFNAEGISKIPVGIIEVSLEDSMDFQSATDSFLQITKYSNIDDCIKDIRRYNKYVCIEIIGGEPYTVRVHFDNTREPIIWEIVEKIKSAIDYMQAQKSKEMAEGVLHQFETVGEKLEYFHTGIGDADSVLNSHIKATDQGVVKLKDAHTDLEDTLDSMDQDINTITVTKNDMKFRKDSLYYSSHNKINYIKNTLDAIPSTDPYYYSVSSVRQEVNALNNLIEDYNDDAEDSFSDVDDRISLYKERSTKGRVYLSDIDNSITDLGTTKDNLYTYKTRLSSLGDEIGEMKESMDEAGGMDADTLISPIKLKNRALYVPELKDSHSTLFDDMFKGINMIGLQTLFPKLLLLIVMFLSLLISTFICLSEINSISNIRVSIIRGISFHEFLSTYLSSLFIVLPSIVIVIFLGFTIFELPIPLLEVAAILFLLSTTFIMLGMLLSYLVVKESITLLITTFLLMFLLFFSGYILPIERMSPASKLIAEISPGKVTLDAFNKMTFYAQPFSQAYAELSMLLSWCLFMALSTYIVKHLRNM
jgi:hypothetical protein